MLTFDDDDVFADLQYQLVWQFLTGRALQLTYSLKHHGEALKTGIKGN